MWTWGYHQGIGFEGNQNRPRVLPNPPFPSRVCKVGCGKNFTLAITGMRDFKYINININIHIHIHVLKLYFYCVDFSVQ
jgi:hypothetical protein